MSFACVLMASSTPKLSSRSRVSRRAWACIPSNTAIGWAGWGDEPRRWAWAFIPSTTSSACPKLWERALVEASTVAAYDAASADAAVGRARKPIAEEAAPTADWSRSRRLPRDVASRAVDEGAAGRAGGTNAADGARAAAAGRRRASFMVLCEEAEAAAVTMTSSTTFQLQQLCLQLCFAGEQRWPSRPRPICALLHVQMLRTLLLLAAVAATRGASPWIRPASPLKGPLSTHLDRSDTSRAPCCNGRRRRSPAFLVPRGGAIVDASGYSDFVEESDGEQIYSIEEASDDADDSTDIEEDGDELHQAVLDRLALLSSTSRSLSSAMVRYAALLMQMTRRACVAGARAIASGREAEGEDRERPVVHTILGRTVYVFGEMCSAALTPEEGGELDVGEEEGRVDGGGRRRKKRRRRSKRKHGHQQRRRKHTRQTHVTRPTEVVCNGGAMDPSNNHAILQLAKQFDVELPTDDTGRLSNRYDAILPSTHTTLAEALQKANGDARFLVCYISKGGRSDAVAIPNLLSSEFVKVANRRPLGKKQSGDTASYYVWICTDAKEAEVATKRLKAKPPTSRSKGKGKRKGAAPILTIVYPASAVDPSGRLKVTPRTLAQHHCHPPPSSPDTLIAWTGTIRKRHLREFAKLQHDRKELQLLRERTEGYASSVQEDRAREEKEEREEQKKREEEERERQRVEELEERRKELLEALPEEPEAGAGVMTIALRFADGKRDQRRFVAEDTSVNDVFNWIDATHKMEREKVELSTMNGARQFRYAEGDDEDGGTLEEAGLGRMTALRVSEIAEEEERDEEGSEEGEEEDEYDEEESDDEESEYEESDDE
ncbi:hypothetical protein ACHAXT_011422 [Thalassiosira profunda]